MHDYLIAWLGGLLLGVAVIGYLYIHGRIAGISGMVAQVLNHKTFALTPARWFLFGMIITAIFYGLVFQPKIEMMVTQPWLLIISGLLVGFGTSMGSGCTSGHGICGISRLSKRSIIATISFMVAGIATVWLTRHLWGILS